MGSVNIAARKLYFNVDGNIVIAEQLMTEQYGAAVQFSSQVLPRGKIKIEPECKLTIALGVALFVAILNSVTLCYTLQCPLFCAKFWHICKLMHSCPVFD